MNEKLTKTFVLTRDRVSYAQQCIDALLATEGLMVCIVDIGSTYPPMLNWLSWVYGNPTMPVSLRSLPADTHPRDLWTNGFLEQHLEPGERFIVTDCDVLPPSTSDWQTPWLTALNILLDHRGDVVKAGLSLRVDDLPERYEHAQQAADWEAKYRSIGTTRQIPGASLWYNEASVDTTLALYRWLEPFAIDPAVRLRGVHYEAQHLTWYEDSANPTEELRWYRDHARADISHWLNPDAFIGTHGLEPL